MNLRNSRTFRGRFSRGYCRRGGYALMMVLVFVVLFLTVLGVAWRQIGAVMRIETVRAKQASRDRGSLCAVAEGLRLLETGLPELGEEESAISYSTTIGGGEQWYKVTFSRDPNDSSVWTVSAAGEEAQSETQLPSVFTQ